MDVKPAVDIKPPPVSPPRATASPAAKDDSPFAPDKALVRVSFNVDTHYYFADGVRLVGAHATIKTLITAPHSVRPLRVTELARAGSRGLAGGGEMHHQLQLWAEGGAWPTHDFAAAIAARIVTFDFARVYPEVMAGWPAGGVATRLDAVGVRAGRRLTVLEFKSGETGVHTNALLGKWATGIHAAMALANVQCTGQGKAVLQAVIGAICLAETFGLRTEDMDVLVLRVGAGSVRLAGSERVLSLGSVEGAAVVRAVRHMLLQRMQSARKKDAAGGGAKPGRRPRPRMPEWM